MDSSNPSPARLADVAAAVTGRARRAGRREFLRGAASVGLLGSLAGCSAGDPTDTPASSPGDTTSSPPTDVPTGTARPVGVERPAREDATHVVNRASELFEAVREPDALVWVPGRTTIDCRGAVDQWVAPGVTIASNREPEDGRSGGRIVAGETSKGTHLFRTYSPDVRVTGLRLEGPDDSWLQQYDLALSRTFGLFVGADCEFDHNEVSGWPFAGFAHGGLSRTPSHEIHHNHFHDNLMEGLGYGVELFNGHHRIHHNYFDRCRHAIAGFGPPTNGYEAWYNVVGPEPLSHAFDMHGLAESLSVRSDVAGGEIHVHDNLFQFTTDIAGRPQEAVTVRGVPADGCLVEENYFQHPTEPEPPGDQGDAFRQGEVRRWRRFRHRGNVYGATQASR